LDPLQLFKERQKEVDSQIRIRTEWELRGQRPETSNGECRPSSRLKTIAQAEATKTDKLSMTCPALQKHDCDHSLIPTDFNMENAGCSQGSETVICGNTKRNSDVHIQYYSWETTDFMKPVPPHAEYANKTIFLSSFISNCNGGDRLDKLRELQDELERKLNHTPTFKVRNYGPCAGHNADQEQDIRLFYPPAEAEKIISQGRDKMKDFLAQKSFFVFSYENSQTEDYVTEKLFNMLSSATIPLYRGAPNARIYAPSMKSIVIANEYEGDAAKIAEALVHISSTKENYEAYFEWKARGNSPDLKWIALIDEGLVHSDCRACILTIDSIRHGLSQNPKNQTKKKWWIRERGTLDFIGFDSISTDHFTEQEQWDLLRFQISNAFASDQKPNGSGAVIQIYEAFDRNQCLQINSMQDMQQKLSFGSFLEVVLENPGWKLRQL